MEGIDVLVEVSGPIARLTPPDGVFRTHCVQAAITAASYIKRDNEEGSSRCSEVEVCLADEVDGTIHFPSGLRARVHDALSRLGYKITTKLKPYPKLHVDVESVPEYIIQSLRDNRQQYDVTNLILLHPEGFMVSAPPGWGKTYLITHLCRMLTKSNVAIVMPPPKELTKMLRDRLVAQGTIDVGSVGDGECDVRRITITTAQSMGKLAGVPWDLVIFDEAHKFASDTLAEDVERTFPTAKRVGLTASPIGRSDWADMAVEALIGPVVYAVPYQDSVDKGRVVPIQVVVYDVPHGPKTDSREAATVNRICVWTNQYRNNMIARIVRQIPETEQVLIMVSTTEHALHLRNLLPDFEVVFSDVSNEDVRNQIDAGVFAPIVGYKNGKLSDERREQLRVGFEDGTIRRAIATGVWNTGVSFNQLTYLVRAEAMASKIASIQTPGRLSRLHEGKNHGVLIDFNDRFSRGLHKRYIAREECYKEQGWPIQMMRAL